MPIGEMRGLYLAQRGNEKYLVWLGPTNSRCSYVRNGQLYDCYIPYKLSKGNPVLVNGEKLIKEWDNISKVPNDLEAQSIEDNTHTFVIGQDGGTQLALVVTYTKDIGGSVVSNEKIWEKIKQEQLGVQDSSIDIES